MGYVSAAGHAESICDQRPGNERPDVRLLPIVLHRHRRLVSEYDFAGCDQSNDAMSERRDQFTSSMKQIGHRAARHRNAESSELLLHSVEGQ